MVRRLDQAAEQPGEATGAMGELQFGEEARQAAIADGDVVPAGFLAERAGEPGLAADAGAGDQQVAAVGGNDPAPDVRKA